MKHAFMPVSTLAALLGLGLITTSALAQDSAHPHSLIDQKTIVIDLDSLNPVVPADASALLARVVHAVGTACTRNDDMRYIFLAADRAACRKTSYTAAVAQINRALDIDLETLSASARPDAAEALAAALPR